MSATSFLVGKDLSRDRVFTVTIAILSALLVTVLAGALGGTLTNVRNYDIAYSHSGSPDVVLKFGPGNYQAQDVRDIAQLAGVSDVRTSQGIEGRITANGEEAPLILMPISRAPEVDVVGEEVTGHTDAVALPKVTARALHVTVGDTVDVVMAGTTIPLRVSALTQDPVFGSPIMGLKRALVDPAVISLIQEKVQAPDTALSTVVSVEISPEVGRTLGDQAKAVIEAFPGTSRADFAYDRDFVRRAYTMIPGIISALLLLVTLTLAFVLSLVLRQIVLVIVGRDWRASGILKAIGFTAGQVRRRLTARLVAFAAAGAMVGALISLVVIPWLADSYLESNGLSRSGPLVLWPGLAGVGVCVGLVALITGSATRPLRGVRPRDAVVVGGGTRRPGVGVHLPRRLVVAAPDLALAITDVRRQPSRYVTLGVATLLSTFLSLSLISLSANFGSRESVSQTLGLNTYDIAVSRTGADGSRAEDWLAHALRDAGLEGSVAFASSMQQASLGTDAGTVVATVSHALPATLPIRDGGAPGTHDEVLLASRLATELHVSVGDEIALRSGDRAARFAVTGLFETVNQTGLTLWLTDEGYRRLDPDFEPRSFVVDLAESVSTEDRETAILRLNETGEAVAVSGRAGVASLVSAVQAAVVAILAVFLATTAVIAAIVSLLLCVTLLAAETRELAVREALGTARRSLCRQLAGRMGLVALTGSLLGAVAAVLVSGPLLGGLLGGAGLSSLRLEVPAWSPALVCVVVSTVAFISARVGASSLPRLSPRMLTED